MQLNNILSITSLFATFWPTGKHFGDYEHYNAGRDFYYRILEKLGVEVIVLERSDQFVPIDTVDGDISKAYAQAINTQPV